MKIVCAVAMCVLAPALHAWSGPVDAAPLHASSTAYAESLVAAARVLQHAVRSGIVVPRVHVASASQNRGAASTDRWLQIELAGARREHNRKTRSTELRNIAAALQFLAAQERIAAHVRTPHAVVTATVKQILSNPAYRVVSKPAPPPKPSIWQKIIAWIADRLAAIFEGIAKAASGVPGLGSIFAVLIIAFAVVALGFVGYRLASGLTLRRRREILEGEPLEDSVDSERLQGAALVAAAQGDYARAIKLIFRASLLALDRRWRVPYDPARTAGEYRRMVRRKAAPAAVAFDALARVFTLAAYAETPAEMDDWISAESSYRSLLPALHER